MNLPDFVLNRVLQTWLQHQNGVVLCFALVLTFVQSRCGRPFSFGQRRSMNHRSAVWSTENILKNLRTQRPLVGASTWNPF